jgi:predicted MFS family arabinose efflux permease
MGRLILGIALGVLVAMATVFAVDLAGHQIYPLPSDLDMDDYEAVGEFVGAMPAGAVAFVLLAWFLGAVDGGVVAAAISRRAWTVWPVVALAAAAGVVSILMIPHPVLQQIGVVAAVLLGGLVASLAARRIVAVGAGRPDARDAG